MIYLELISSSADLFDIIGFPLFFSSSTFESSLDVSFQSAGDIKRASIFKDRVKSRRDGLYSRDKI